MKLSHCNGNMFFRVKDNEANICLNCDNQRSEEMPEDLRYLTIKQIRGMGCRPDMIVQYAHFLKEVWAKKLGHENLSVYADVICALNGRPPRRMIDPNVDLAKEKEGFIYPRWLLPLDKNLRAGSGEIL